MPRRLDSWKEIAAFFGRDERTVRRWEKERSLPVHRVPGKGRGSVYAFTAELAEWLNSPGLAEQSERASAETYADNVSLASGRNHYWLWAGAIALVALGALAIPRVLGGGGTPAPPAAAVHHVPTAQAKDLYLQGRYEWSRRSPESLAKALDLFTQAIVRDPDYAEAYAGLADTYNLLREYSTMPDGEAYPRAITAAKKAIELNNSLGGAHRSLAFGLLYWAWDFGGAEREFKRAIELSPQDAEAHHWYGTALASLGRYQEALDELERARQLEPSSASIVADRAIVLYEYKPGPEAVALLQQVESVDPAFLSPHRYLAVIALVQRDYATYLIEARREAELQHDRVKRDVVRAAEAGFASAGEAGLLRELRKARQKYYDKGLISAYDLSQACALSGDRRDAIYYLGQELQKHGPGMVGIGIDPALNSLHQEPAFRDLLARAGLPPMEN